MDVLFFHNFFASNALSPCYIKSMSRVPHAKEEILSFEKEDEPDALERSEDTALMQKVRHGDMDAFQVLVERHQERVVGTIAKMLGDRFEAEDIAQTVFIRVWKSAARYRPTARFTTWLLTITRNLVFNEMRRRHRHPVDAMETEEMPLGAHGRHADSSVVSPAVHLQMMELEDAIETAIALLPEPQRMTLILRRYEELPYEEIAKVMGTSIPAVKSLLFRARKELQKLLAGYLASDRGS